MRCHCWDYYVFDWRFSESRFAVRLSLEKCDWFGMCNDTGEVGFFVKDACRWTSSKSRLMTHLTIAFVVCSAELCVLDRLSAVLRLMFYEFSHHAIWVRHRMVYRSLTVNARIGDFLVLLPWKFKMERWAFNVSDYSSFVVSNPKWTSINALVSYLSRYFSLFSNILFKFYHAPRRGHKLVYFFIHYFASFRFPMKPNADFDREQKSLSLEKKNQSLSDKVRSESFRSDNCK
jgi:hypothetical protein